MKLKKLVFLSTLLMMGLSLVACSQKMSPKSTVANTSTVNLSLYRNFYEIFPGSFADSNGDGEGDLNGITAHLDYLNTGKADSTTDLKVQGIWMTPIFASPSYHGYDITNYEEINPKFGTMTDFENLVKEAKKRNIAVVLDLVLNHTSVEHPWFQKALAGNKKYMAYYNWSDTAKQNYSLASNGKYYESEFDKGMPDLNLSNPDVKAEIKAITEFWLSKGIAGFRLDAVGYYFNDSTAKTQEFTKWLVTTIHSQKPNAYVVGEDWSSSDTISELSQKSKINSLFNFPMSFHANDGALQSAFLLQDGSTFSKQVTDWDKTLHEANPAAIDAPFLTNHDMDRAINYTNTLAESKMAAQTYLLLPGNPYIYYGEELGLSGSGIDQNKRLPIPWTADGKGSAIASVSVPGATMVATTLGGSAEEQEADPNSLLNWYKKILRIKAKYPDIASSRITEIDMTNSSLSALNYGNKYTVISNFDSQNSAKVTLTSAMKKNLAESLSVTGEKVTLTGKSLTLPAYSTVILK